MIPLGRNSSPSPARRLMSRPPMNEPPTPATNARVQSIPVPDLPTTSCATAPTSSPNRIIPMINIARVQVDILTRTPLYVSRVQFEIRSSRGSNCCYMRACPSSSARLRLHNDSVVGLV